MAKLRITKEDWDQGGALNTVEPGIYTVKVVSAKDRMKTDAKKPELEISLTVQSGPAKGERLLSYQNYSENATWKIVEIVKALGLLKGPGTLDTERIAREMTGKICKVQVVQNNYFQDEYRAKVKTWMAASKPDQDAAEDEEPEDEEPEGEPDEDEEPEEEEPEGDEEPEVDLDELDRAALKKLISERELGIRVTRGMSDDDIRDKIAEAFSEPDEDEEPEPDEEQGYESWTDAELEAELKGRKIRVPATRKARIASLEKYDEDHAEE